MYKNAEITKVLVYSLSEDGPGHRISDHFTLLEFACGDGSDIVLIHPAFADFAEELRTRIDMPLHLSSAYRTWWWHKEIYRKLGKPVTKRSAHLWGMAGDFVCDDMALLEREMNELNPGGMGLYNSFIHGDVKGENRRWNNRT